PVETTVERVAASVPVVVEREEMAPTSKAASKPNQLRLVLIAAVVLLVVALLAFMVLSWSLPQRTIAEDLMTEAEIAPQQSIVVADFGQGTSRAFLLEQVGGAFRFVAKAEGPTTSTLPFENVSIGWMQLLRQLEWATGRSLTSRDGLAMPQQESGDG